jgi:hypothetical protein
MRLSARIEVNMNTAAVKAAGQGFAREFADTLGKRAAELARENVRPGSGPGPHPHRPVPPFRQHTDTGELLRSIQLKAVSMGFLETTQVYTDLDWGLYLEAGWHSASGRFWRYPWLLPAMMQAQQEAAGIAQSTSRRWFSDTGAPYKGRVNFSAPLSGTAWPE